MTQKIKITLIELLFLAILSGCVAVGQLYLTIAPAQNRINAHLAEAEKAIAKYKESETDISKTLEDIFNTKAEYAAYLIREGYAAATEKGLQSLCKSVDAKSAYIYEQGEDEGQNRGYYISLSSNGITDADKVQSVYLEGENASGGAAIDDEHYLVINFDAIEIYNALDEAYSWEGAIVNGGVGQNGYTFVTQKKDLVISEFPDESLEGETIKPWHMDEESLRAKIEGSIKMRESGEEPDFLSFVPMVVGTEPVVGFAIAVENPKYANSDEIDPDIEEYVFCVIPFSELIDDYLKNGGMYAIVFFTITVLYLLYIFFSERKRREDAVYAQKLLTYPFLGMFAVFCLCLFLSRLNMVSSNLLNCRSYAESAVDMSERIDRSTEKVQELISQQYLSACRIAAEILTKNPEYRTREGMHSISSMIHVKYTYLFDRNGKTVVTDSPYDQFELSKDEDSQSYAFRVLLEGVDHLVQDPMPDDSTGKLMQYVGVSIRNEDDLADGFVQIAIETKEIQRLNKNVNMSTRLGNIDAGEGGYAFMVDEDGVVTNSGKKKMEGKTTEELGIKKKQMTDGYSGYMTLEGVDYYAAASKTEAGVTFFVVVPRQGMVPEHFFIIAIAAILSLLCMMRMGFAANKKPDGMDPAAGEGESASSADEAFSAAEEVALAAGEAEPASSVAGASSAGGEAVFAAGEAESAAGASSADGDAVSETKRHGFGKKLSMWFKNISDVWGIEMNEALERRWNHNIASWSDRSPEAKTFLVVQVGMVLFCLYVIYRYFFGNAAGGSNSFLLYILSGQWEKGFNIFAVSASLMIICIIYLLVQVFEQVLYWIAKVSDTKTETICHLLYSLIKYGAVITVIYYCLSLFGFETRTLVASAGILTAVIGFGSNKLISDVISGLFLVFENQFSVGDFVRIGDWVGVVTEIGIRTTKIAGQDSVKSFNNSEISGLINYNAMAIGRITLEIGVAYEESIDRLVDIFAKEFPGMGERIIGAVGDPAYDGIQRFGDSSVCLRFHLYVHTATRAKSQRAFNREIYACFRRNNIEIPYQKVEVSSAVSH